MLVNWRSFYEAGSISRVEYDVCRAVESNPHLATEALLMKYLSIRVKHGLLEGRHPLRVEHAPAGGPAPDGAFQAYLEANNELDTHHSLKVRLLLKILDPESRFFGKDYRDEWNRIVGFELFKILEHP